MSKSNKKVTISQLLQFTVAAAVVFAVDSAIGAPVLLATTVLAIVPAMMIRSMYRSGLESAGVDPDMHTGSAGSRILPMSLLACFLAFFFIPLVGWIISAITSIWSRM